jgi:hypothetical protein
MVRISFASRAAFAGLVIAGLAAASPVLAQQTDGSPPVRVIGRTTAPATTTAPPVIRPIRPMAVNPGVLQALGTKTEITPPAAAPVVAGTDGVTLRQGSHSQVMRGLKVIRTVPLAQAASPIMLGNARVDLAPVLNDPKGLPAIAKALRQQAQLGEVTADTTEIIEVDRGLVIRNYMSYRLRSGTCSDPARRGTAVRSGLSCFSPRTEAERAAAFANPRDPRYIEDPVARQHAIATARTETERTRARVAGYVGQLRAGLKNPTRRAELAQRFGAAELARFDGLTDEQLTSEVVNTGERRLEQILFVPNLNAPITNFSPKLQNLIKPGATPLFSVVSQTATPDMPLTDYVFLTGFTLGRKQEWRKRVEVTIPWCLLGCEETYFGEAYAGYSFGFGLRFPIRAGGKYSLGSNGQASVTPTFAPFNGELKDYDATGLAAEKQFEGKEFVAEVKAWAGANYYLPVVGSGGEHFELGKDFTEKLPYPFTNGQFTPPAPNETTPPASVVFRDIDLIGGRANFGFAGAKVFPMLDVSLTSNSLTMKVKDDRVGGEGLRVSSGQQVPLTVDPATQASSFSLKDPEYSIAFVLTPGVVANLFVDVGVWADSWDWKVPFPQLSITVPSGGVTFDCHKGTLCTRKYVYGANVKKETAGPKSALSPDDYLFMEGEATPQAGQTWASYYQPQIATWAKGFDGRYMKECHGNEPCWKTLQLIRINAETKMFAASASTPQRPFLTPERITADIKQHGDTANALARMAVRPHSVRAIGEAYAKGRVAKYIPQCKTPKCQTAVKFISSAFVANLVSAEKKAPSAADEAQIFGTVMAQQDWEKMYQNAVNETN